MIPQLRKNLIRWGRLLGTFFLGQGACQVVQLATGFLLIRWMEKGDYATYTMVIAILGTSSILFSLGLSQCLTGIIGKKISEPQVVGRYIKASRMLRNRLLIVGAFVLLAVFYLISGRFNWGDGQWLGLWFFVVATMFFKIWEQSHSPVLLLKQQVGKLYALDFCGNFSRLLLVGLAQIFHLLTAPVALLFNALQSALNCYGIFRMSRSSIEVPDPSQKCEAEKKEILRLTWPKIPNFIFSAFSGQLIIFIVGIFGTTGEIAEIGALSRVAMLFIVFKRFGNIMVTPYFAKLDFIAVPKRLCVLFSFLFAFMLGISVLVYVWPEPLLFLLGESYLHLQYEVFLIVLLALLQLCNVQVVAVNHARKYVFPWHALAVLLPQLVMISVGVVLFDLSHLPNVIYFSMLLSITRICSNVSILLIGMRREQSHA